MGQADPAHPLAAGAHRRALPRHQARDDRVQLRRARSHLGRPRPGGRAGRVRTGRASTWRPTGETGPETAPCPSTSRGPSGSSATTTARRGPSATRRSAPRPTWPRLQSTPPRTPSGPGPSRCSSSTKSCAPPSTARSTSRTSRASRTSRTSRRQRRRLRQGRGLHPRRQLAPGSGPAGGRDQGRRARLSAAAAVRDPVRLLALRRRPGASEADVGHGGPVRSREPEEIRGKNGNEQQDGQRGEGVDPDEVA